MADPLIRLLILALTILLILAIVLGGRLLVERQRRLVLAITTLIDSANSARPWFVPPRKQNKSQFMHNIRVRNIEVVLQRRVGNETTKLMNRQ